VCSQVGDTVLWGVVDEGWMKDETANGENKPMRKKQWMWLSAALLALMLVGCKDDNEVKTCKSDSDCDKEDLCHPAAGVCVKTCKSTGDCPNSSKKCAAISETDTREICKCSTDALCNDGKKDSNLVCNEAYKVCVPKDKDKDVIPPDEVGTTCDSSKPQPDVCKHGLVCGSDNKCKAAPDVTCDYFPALPSDPTGPIIYSARLLSNLHNDDTTTHGNGRYCPSSRPWHMMVELKAYSKDSQLVSRTGSTPLTIYLSKTSTEKWTDNVRPSEWVNDGPDHATVIINACYVNNGSYTIGAMFDNGNAVCVNN